FTWRCCAKASQLVTSAVAQQTTAQISRIAKLALDITLSPFSYERSAQRSSATIHSRQRSKSAWGHRNRKVQLEQMTSASHPIAEAPRATLCPPTVRFRRSKTTANRTSFAPETTSPECNERDRNQTKTQQNQRSWSISCRS